MNIFCPRVQNFSWRPWLQTEKFICQDNCKTTWSVDCWRSWWFF